MHQKVKSICILGSGSAGWVTVLGILPHLPDLDITIICSKKHSSVGVGESTQPDLIDLLEKAGIDLPDFMQKTDATFKHGMYFKNWNGEGTDYWHPFSALPREGMYSRAHHYHMMSKRDPINFPRKDYYKRVHPSYTLAIENNLTSTDIGHALHVNAEDFANYVKNYVKNSIKIVEADTYEVQHNTNTIDCIAVNRNQIIKADLYIDCTGFNKALISKISDLKHDGYEANVNTALFGRVHYSSPNVKFIPYTKGEAVKHGWIWTTPLRSQVGTGCVYHDQYTTEEEAKECFVDYWQGALKKENIRKIPFPSTSLMKPWTGNVVAVGLASGWIEPLEATGISTFIQQVNTLTRFLINRYYDQDVIDRYNSSLRNYIEDVQDFIDIHYLLSARRDSAFWKWATSRQPHPRLEARLSVFKKFMPNVNNKPMSYNWGFNDISWIDTLTGYDFDFDDINAPIWLQNKRDLEIYTNFS